MARIPTAAVTLELLYDITEEFDIMDKIRDGRLTTEEISRRQSGDPRLPNAYGRMLKHYTRGESPRHIATSHQTVGTPEEHWHVTDFAFQEVRFIRPIED